MHALISATTRIYIHGYMNIINVTPTRWIDIYYTPLILFS
jgi:hypothetical protein